MTSDESGAAGHVARPSGTEPGESPVASPASATRRWFFLIVVIVLAAAAMWASRNTLSLANLAAQETKLREFAESHPAATYVVAFVVYVVVTGLALPVATGLSLAYGWFFGFWRSLILVSFASTSGATVSFLVSRYVLGDWLQRRYGQRLANINSAVEREGAFYLFTLRLIPYVPFFLINVGMGLSRMSVGTFWWVSQIGMLPGTCVYLLAASSVKSLAELQREGLSGILTPRLGAAFILLGLFPLFLRRAVTWLRSE